METPIFELQSVSKVFTLGGAELPVINNITMSFSSPGLILISGKSGSGKSTLLNLIAGIVKPTSGHVTCNGKALDGMGEKHICAYRNRMTGFIFQHYNLFDKQSTLFNIILPLLIDGQGIQKAYETGRRLLASYHMENLAKQEVGKLSGGEKQRVAVLRALINDPSLILADEPTGALDRENAQLTMKMLQDIAQRKIVVVVSHDVELTRKYANRHIIIKDGAIVSDILLNNHDQ